VTNRDEFWRYCVRVSDKEVRGLIGPVEAVQAGLWFVAERYLKYREEIYPDGWQVSTTMPLADPHLFLSFARLGAHGYPSEEAVMSWIRKHGLLERRDPERWKRLEDGTPNQTPMKIEEFRAEVRKAYDVLTLFQQIRSKDIDALRGRVGRARVYLPNPPANWPSRDGSTARARVTIDGVPTSVDTLADGELSDEDVLSLAVKVLEEIVEQKIRHYGVTLVFSENDDHPRPLSPTGGYGFTSYRPELTLKCLNLGSALWYQFGALISNKRPLLNCEECGLPFVGRRDAKTCSDACRKAKSRRTQEHKGDS
jgi:hypothetical protein